MTKKESIHVTPNQNKWNVQREGTTKPSRVCDTKAEAESVARDQGRNQKTEVVIHNRNGRISQKNSYGNDPCPPKDKD